MSDSQPAQVEENQSVAAEQSDLQPHTKKHGWKRWLLRLVIFYCCWLLVIFFGQRFFIFMGAYHDHDQPDGPTDERVEQVWYEPESGVRVEGWFVAGDERTGTEPGPAVLFIHGNNHVIDDDWQIHAPYVAAGYSYLAIELRGYGRSTGTPGEDAVIADSLWFYDWLAARPEVDAERIVLHGNSIGGAIAIALAAQREPVALILESTFHSLESLFPRLGVPAALCRFDFRSDLRLQDIEAPILAIHGTRDWIIPMKHSRRIVRDAQNATFVETSAGHMNYDAEWPAIKPFLAELGLPEIK